MIVYTFYLIFSCVLLMAAFYFSWQLGLRKSNNKFIALGGAVMGYVGTHLLLRGLSSADARIHGWLLEKMIQFQASTTLTFVHTTYIQFGMIMILATFCLRRSGPI